MVRIDPALQAATRRAITRAAGALQVTFSRDVGVAPAIVTTSATVVALVRDYRLNSQEAGQDGFTPANAGAISVGDRQILVMADALAEAGFPLPLVKGDRVTVETGDKMTLTRVDALKRAVAGCIEATGTGV